MGHHLVWFWLYWTSRFVHVPLRLSGLLPWMFHVWQDADVHPLPATGFAFHSLFLRVSCHEVGMLQKPSKNGRCLKDDIDTTIYPTNSLILQSRTTAISSNRLKLPPVTRPQLQQLQTTCQARNMPLAADQQHSRALAMWAKAQCSQHPARRISTILQRLRDEGQLGAKHRTGLELVMGRNYINDSNILIHIINGFVMVCVSLWQNERYPCYELPFGAAYREPSNWGQLETLVWRTGAWRSSMTFYGGY